MAKFTFQKNYLFATLLLFAVEVCIALFVRDKFVRPYVGDFLVVILIYCFLKIFWQARPWVVGLFVFLFAVGVEVGQHFQLVNRLGLGDSEVARTVIGTGFDWGDMLAYALGIVTVLVFECRKF